MTARYRSSESDTVMSTDERKATALIWKPRWAKRRRYQRGERDESLRAASDTLHSRKVLSNTARKERIL